MSTFVVRSNSPGQIHRKKTGVMESPNVFLLFPLFSFLTVVKPDQKPESKRWHPSWLAVQATSSVTRIKKRVDAKVKIETYRMYNGGRDTDLRQNQGGNNHIPREVRGDTEEVGLEG